jgi:hypothetical protein
MQEQDRGRILRAGLAIEDRQAVDADGAVRRAIHGCLRSHQGWPVRALHEQLRPQTGINWHLPGNPAVVRQAAERTSQ